MSLLLWMALPGLGGSGFDHSLLDIILKQHVNENSRVDYAALKAHPEDLSRYVKLLAERSPASHPADFASRESKLVYWINAYNAFTLQGVIEHWPIESVRSIGGLYGFFWRTKFTAGGQKYTLNHIENVFLREQLKEPRIHFAIVCASNSCPRLSRDAYTAENLERNLEGAARYYFSENRNVKVDAARNQVWLSRIMSFYRKDFEDRARQNLKTARTSQPLLEYVRLYAGEKTGAGLADLKNPTIVFFDYDWGINDVNAPNPSPKYVKPEAQP